MNLITYLKAWLAIILRLRYLATYQRNDIVLFAPLFARVLAGLPFSALALPADFDIWVRRAKIQLKLERHLPAGTRLGTFRYSPVLALDAIRQRKVSYPAQYWVRIEQDIRANTGLKLNRDAQMDKRCGYSVSAYIRALQLLNATDPVTVQLFLAKEFRFCAAAKTLEEANDRVKAATKALEQDALLRAGTSLAEHERLVSIAKELHQSAALDYKGLVAALEELEAGRRLYPGVYSDYLETVPLSVPALFTVAALGRWDRFAPLREVIRVLRPQGRGGERTARPLVHYYGLDLAQIIQMGMVELMTINANIIDPRVPIHKLTRGGVQNDRVVGLARAIIDDIAKEEKWPITLNNELRRKLDPVQRGYLRGTWQFGGGGRFDPRYWLDPERDAYLCKALVHPKKKAKLRRTGSVVDLHYRVLMRLSQISFSKSERSAVAQNVSQQFLIIRAMAHMACAHSPFTSDPIFVAWHRFNLNVGGYCSTRGARRQKKAIPVSVVKKGQRFKGALLPTHKGPPREAGMDFPIEGLVTADVIRQLGKPPENLISQHAKRQFRPAPSRVISPPRSG